MQELLELLQKRLKLGQPLDFDLVIFDKDGTLTEPASGGAFVEGPEDQRLKPGVYDVLLALWDADIPVAIATNQGGCSAINKATGKPYKSVQEACEEQAYCIGLMPEEMRDDVVGFLCPDFKGRECWRVKLKSPEFIGDKHYDAREALPWIVEGDAWVPDTIYYSLSPSSVVGKCRKLKDGDGSGMLTFSMHEFDCLNNNRVLMVGDRPEDRQAAVYAGTQFLKV